MTAELIQRYRMYFDRFAQEDEYRRFGSIPDEQAADFLLERIPLLELPDQTLEIVYAYRWWSFRKHLKKTDDGWVITEFLPDVYWAGRHNTINCAAGFHIREGRWLKDAEEMISQYIDFWLKECGSSYSYSMWLASAIREYNDLRGDKAFLSERLDRIIHWFEKRNSLAADGSGLYYSVDDRDGMEYSISGSGLRPTLNSYVCADAYAVASFAEAAGRKTLAKKYLRFADGLKEKLNRLLWDGDFFRTIPCEKKADRESLAQRPPIDPGHDVRELIGYIPWYFHLAQEGYEKAFDRLLPGRGFDSPFGLTSAEQSHSRYLEEHDHECLWNGPIWPFATSQVLVAAANMLRDRGMQSVSLFGKDDYFLLLKQYAASHFRVNERGEKIFWIDENIDPVTGKWLSREILEKNGFTAETGGVERGMNYNHSLFCDLILSGLLGIGCDEMGEVTVNPLLPSDWQSFRVENLWLHGACHTVQFDAGRVRIQKEGRKSGKK